MSVERSLPAAPESVAAARRFALSALSDLPQQASDDLALMVSELATNCVVHARRGFRVAVRRTECGIQVEVTDAGDGHAEMAYPSATDPHGRGLHIVDQLSDEWGVEQSPSRPGKTVWFRLSTRDGEMASDGAAAADEPRSPSGRAESPLTVRDRSQPHGWSFRWMRPASAM